MCNINHSVLRGAIYALERGSRRGLTKPRIRGEGRGRGLLIFSIKVTNLKFSAFHMTYWTYRAFGDALSVFFNKVGKNGEQSGTFLNEP